MVKLSDDEKWYRVSLRLMGDGLLVDNIEEKLGLVPSNIGKKGQHYQDNPKRGKYETNVWVWSCPEESDVPFEMQITSLLSILEPKKGILKEIMSMPDIEGELFLGFGSMNGQGGAYFSNELLKRVAECGLSMDMDLYPPPNDGKD